MPDYNTELITLYYSHFKNKIKISTACQLGVRTLYA